MGGTLGSVAVYLSYGASILVMYSTISPWIGGGVVELFIYPITTRLASRSIGCGGREDMGGRVGSTSPYHLGSTLDGSYDGHWPILDIIDWFYGYVLSSAANVLYYMDSISWELVRQMAHEFA